MSADTAGAPIATADCEPGDAVVIVPVPAPGLDTHEPVHATVTRATDAALYAETDGGERYRRDRLGHLERASERRASGLESTFWTRIAHDSELRRAEADGGPEQPGSEHLERRRWDGNLDALDYETEDFEGGESVVLRYEDHDGNECTIHADCGGYQSHNSWLIMWEDGGGQHTITVNGIVRRDVPGDNYDTDVLGTAIEVWSVETDGGEELGVECDVDGCEERVVGLDDGYEFSRGVVCQSCIDYNERHAHWPDDDVEICVECKIDAGAVSHECPDAGAVDSVLVDAGEDCPYCGETQRKVATDGGTATAGADRTAFASLAFAGEHVDAIRRGEKTVTLRLPSEYDAAVVHAAERGSEVLLETPDGEPFARAAMRGRFELSPVGIARLATLPGYPTALETADGVLRILERHYGEALVDDATMVDVLCFDVTELLRRETVEASE